MHMNYDFRVSLERLLLALIFRDDSQPVRRERLARARTFVRNAMHQHAATTASTGPIIARQFEDAIGLPSPTLDGPIETLHQLLLTYRVWVAYGIPTPAFTRKLEADD